MIRRLFADEAETVNDWIWRDSGRRPDFEPFLADTNNVCLVEGEGGAVFVWRGPGIYETHCFFEQRGKAVRDISNAMLDHMRQEYGARLFWCAIPDAKESRNVKVYARWLGFKPCGHGMFPQGPCELFTLEN